MRRTQYRVHDMSLRVCHRHDGKRHARRWLLHAIEHAESEMLMRVDVDDLAE